MINLLPSQEKEALVQEENWRLVLILGTLFSAFLASFFLILLSIKIYTSNQAEIEKELLLQKEKAFNTVQNQELQQKISSINQNLLSLDSFYQNQKKPTVFFEKTLELLPQDIFLTSILYAPGASAQGESFVAITISGFAATQEGLLQFKEGLEEEDGFKDVKFPQSVWISKANINFFATFKTVK